MGVAAAIKKTHARRVRGVAEIQAPWKARKRKKLTHRLLWSIGLVAGIGLVISLIWMLLTRES